MDNQFDKMFDAIKQSAETNDQFFIPHSSIKRDRSLSDWIKQLRRLKEVAQSSDKIEEELKEMGFIWWSELAVTKENIALLKHYQQALGQQRIDHTTKFKELPIGRLASKIRMLKFLDSLDPEIFHELDEVRFDWTLMPSDFSD